MLKGFTGEVFLCLKRLTYTASRSVGKLPAYWNLGRVLFVRHDGAKVDVFNPRFILLMPFSQVMQPLDTGKSLLAEKHEFRGCYLGTMQLINVHPEITGGTVAEINFYQIFLGYTKPCDTVAHFVNA